MSLAYPGTPTKGIHRILPCLACPQCRASLAWEATLLRCHCCGTSYPVVNGVPDLRPTPHPEKAELVAWTNHWSDDRQQSFSQRFFSFYRKAIFARTVRYFLDRYFPSRGIFIEAGSGTSETSMRINKREGARTLVAVDIVPPVLERCHPVMDVQVCGDIFSLPFLENVVDGVWNVGVMEHFTHEQIDQIMGEFRRVLKSSSPVILLWPGANSIPQKMLRIVEKLINLKARHEKFQFHPDEISQIRSVQESRHILLRNGFRIVHIDSGLRSLMAFKILVGAKN